MASDREQFVAAELSRLLNATDYRVGAFVLTCPPDEGKGDVRIISAVIMKDPARDLAADLVGLPARLRAVVIAGKQPLPPQQVDQ